MLCNEVVVRDLGAVVMLGGVKRRCEGREKGIRKSFPMFVGTNNP